MLIWDTSKILILYQSQKQHLLISILMQQSRIAPLWNGIFIVSASQFHISLIVRINQYSLLCVSKLKGPQTSPSPAPSFPSPQALVCTNPI